jgi:hypothetical protein
MTIMINNTAHLIITGSYRLVPRRPVKVGDIDKLKKMYPEVSAMIDANQIIVKQDEDASAAVKADEKREVEELKYYAKAHGINVGRANKKESLLAAIKKAEKEAEEKAEKSDD